MSTRTGPSPVTSYQMSTPFVRLKGIIVSARRPSRASQVVDCIRAGAFRADQFEPGRLRERGERAALQRIDAVWADRLAGAQQRGFVDEVGSEHGGGETRSGLDHEPRDAALGQAREHGGKVEP